MSHSETLSAGLAGKLGERLASVEFGRGLER
jgi:hypothetical protein